MNDTFLGIVLALRKSNKHLGNFLQSSSHSFFTLFLPMDYFAKKYKKGPPLEEINQLSVPCLLLVDTPISEAT